MIWPHDWRCVTQSQPYASLIALGAKHVITRADRPHKDDFPIAIVAGPHAAWMHRQYPRIVWDCLHAHGIHEKTHLPTSAVVAVAWMTSCMPSHLCTGISRLERQLGQYDTGLHAWFLVNVFALDEPIDAAPAANLWTPYESLATRLQAIYLAKLRTSRMKDKTKDTTETTRETRETERESNTAGNNTGDATSDTGDAGREQAEKSEAASDDASDDDKG